MKEIIQKRVLELFLSCEMDQKQSLGKMGIKYDKKKSEPAKKRKWRKGSMREDKG